MSNITNLECLTNLKEINISWYLYSACFLNDKNQIHIVTSNFNYSDPLPIKVLDLNGKKFKEIHNSNDTIYFIDIYYEKNFSRIFIISGNDNSVKSFDYKNNQLYHNYFDNQKSNKKRHISIIINNNPNLIQL